jgi:hypothetical protein
MQLPIFKNMPKKITLNTFFTMTPTEETNVLPVKKKKNEPEIK